MSSKRYSNQPFPADLDYCSSRDVAYHLKSLFRPDESDPLRNVICYESTVQYIFELAQIFGQPAIVKLHAVNLLEDLIKKGAKIHRMTFPLIICIAAKLSLSYNRVSLPTVQRFLRVSGYGDHPTRLLMIHEQQILATLDFKVESRTVLQMVETILTLIHRITPLGEVPALLDSASQMSCLYVLYRQFLPERLKHEHLAAACAVAFASKMVLDAVRGPRSNENSVFLKTLAALVRIDTARIVSDTGHLLYVILGNDEHCKRNQFRPSSLRCQGPATASRAPKRD